MSRPRWFKNINDLLRQAKAHGLIVDYDGGHYKIKLNRNGFGPNKIIAVLPTTGPVHTSLMKDQVARIKKETGIDIRRDPARRPYVAPPPVELKAVEPPPPAPVAPERPPITVLTVENLKSTMRDLLMELLQEFASRLVPPTTAPVPAPEPTPPTKPVLVHTAKPKPVLVHVTEPTPKKEPSPRKRKVYLSDEQKKEIVDLYVRGGQDMSEICKLYDVSSSAGFSFLRKAGFKSRKFEPKL